MKLYPAGVFTSSFGKSGKLYTRLTPNEKHQRDYVSWYLESYHYIHRPRMVQSIRRDGVKVFLDSGAFSAYSMGVEIDIGRYCDYILENSDIIEHVDGQPLASVLDAIGDAEGTWRNQVEMERRGVRPLPCFHYGEPTEVLDYYVANYPYITIGGMVPISTPQLLLWLDRLWAKHLTHADGTPKVKVHGFGLTTMSLVRRYPWYSVDSSSWVQVAANGGIFLPRTGKAVSISRQSPAAKVYGQHYLNLPKPMQDAITAEIQEFGGDPERLSAEYLPRWAFNVFAYPKHVDLTGRCNRFEIEMEGLF